MLCLSLACCIARAGELSVAMLPSENWWGLCNSFGRQMPFDEQSDFQCDLRVSNYSHQCLSLLVSDKGRVLYCAEPVEATIGGGFIRFVSDGGKAVLSEAVGTTLAEAFRFASKTYFPPTGEEPELLFFSAPQYNTWIELTYHQNERDVLAYAQSMIDHGLPPGVFMIDDTWQLGYGTWEFDPRRFSDPKGMVAKLHKMGFKVLLWMCPFVSMDSPAYRLLEFGVSPDTVKPQRRGGFVTESETGRAAAVRWWNGRSALVDLSHPNGRDWFIGQLDGLVREFGVDGFKLDGGNVWDYQGTQAHDRSLSLPRQSALYAEMALKYRGSESRNVYGLSGKPVIMRLADKDHSWQALQRIVPDMLAAGLLGYPFICPDMIGGGQWLSFLPGSAFDPELFIRSAQVHALCPMMQISASPWRVLGADHQRIFADAVALRQKFAPKFVALAKKAAHDGEPIIRCLEYNYPGMGYSRVRDEFMMGTDLLVAPVTEQGQKSRKVVIPPGVWQADDGEVYRGPSAVEVETPLSRLPHFVLRSSERTALGMSVNEKCNNNERSADETDR